MSAATSVEVQRESVTAIVVSHGRDGDFFEDTLAALAEQTVKPRAIVVGMPELSSGPMGAVERALNGAVVRSTAGAENMGDAVRKILAAEPVKDSSWLWLLHGDSAPEPDALDRLLRLGETSAKTAIVGPKQIAWDDDERVLLEVGIRATRSARRVVEVEPGERDQGQRDARTDVLAVGSAGMLVRASVWRELGGFNPDLGPFGDGLEFSRRARMAGYRVVVEPSAVVRHARQSMGGVEAPANALDTAKPYGERRRSQNLNALIAAPRALVPFLWIGYILVGLPRSIVRLVWKDPARARGELKASFLTALGIDDVVRGRRALTGLSGGRGLRQLEDTPFEVRRVRRESKKSASEAVTLASAPDPLTLKLRADLRKHTRKGAVMAFLGSLLLAIGLAIPVISGGTLTGGALAPDDSTFGDLWGLTTSTWLPSGDGHAGVLDPLWMALMPFLALGAPLGLTLGTLATALLYLSVPVGVMGAYVAAGRATLSWVVRLIAALLWGVAPHFVAAIGEGRVGAVLVHALAPWALAALVSAWRGSATALGGAALALGAIAAAAPIALPAAIVIAVLGIATRSGARKRWLWLPIPALALLLPSLLQLRKSEILPFLASTPGVPFESDSGALNSYVRIPGTDNLTGIVTFVAIAIIVAAALFALVRRHRWRMVRWGWLLIAGGAAWAVAVRHIDLGETSAWPGVGLTALWLGLLVVVSAGADALRTALKRRSFGPAQMISGLLMVAVPASALALAAVGVYKANVDDSVLRGVNDAAVPALGLTNQESKEASRVLVVTASGPQINAEVWRGAGIELHEYSRLGGLRADAADPASVDLAQAVADFTTGATSVSQALSEHAISMVLVPPAAGDSDEYTGRIIAALHAVPDLEYVTANESGTFWRVTPGGHGAVARAIVVGDSATPIPSDGLSARTELSSSTTERTVYLAERADEDWVAKLDGEELAKADDAWRAAWTIPAGASGELEIGHFSPYQPWLGLGQAVIAAITLVAALPIRRRDTE